MVTPADVVVSSLSVVVCLCLAHHCWNVVLASVCSRCARLGLRQSCWDAWCSVDSFVRQVFSKEVGIIESAIAQQMDECRLARFREFCNALAPFFGVTWLFVTVGPSIGGEAEVHCSDQMTVAQTIFAGCAYICTHLVASGWIKINYWVLGSCYMLAVCSAMVRVLTVQDTYFSVDAPRLVMQQVVPGILFMDYSKTIPCNVLLLFASFGRKLHMSFYIEADCLNYIQQKAIIRDVVLCLVTSVIFYMMQKPLQAQIRLHIISKNQQNATQKLASYNCDALCWLAPNLHFSKPAPQLGSMLFLDANHNDLEGKAFVNYLASESDQERFKESIASAMVSSLSAELPMLLHIDLRDSTGRAFPVHVFHSCYLDDKDRIGHLLGISEASAHAPVVQETREVMPEVAPPPIAADIEPTVLGRAATDAQSAASEQSLVSNGASSLTGDEALTFVPIIPERHALAPVTVLFDAMTFEILGCTTGLTALIGPLAFKTDVRSIIVNFPMFCQWLDDTVNQQLQDTDDPEHTPFDIKIAPPRSENERIFEFHGSAEVLQVEQDVLASAMGVEPVAGCDDEEYDLLCVLEIRDAEVQWISQPKKKKKKKRLARTAGTMTL